MAFVHGIKRASLRGSLTFLMANCCLLLGLMTALVADELDIIAPNIHYSGSDVRTSPGQSSRIDVIVTDNIAVKRVSLYFRFQETSDFEEMPMHKGVKEDQYVAELPPSPSLAVEYYIRAADSAGNIVHRGTSFQPLVVEVNAEEILSEQDNKANFAMLVLESEPSEVDVYFSDVRVGQTPYQNFKVVPGQTVRLDLKKEGYQSKTLEFVIKHGANELLELRLEPSKGIVTVTSIPYERGAKIYVGNRNQVVGRVPAQLSLPAGEYIIEVDGQYSKGQARVTVVGGDSQNTVVRLGDAAALTGSTIRDKLSNGGVGPTMVVISRGYFLMGDETQVRRGEQPQHRVDIAKAYAISVTETTFADYDRFVLAQGLRKPKDKRWGRGQRPVINVSWEDARAYAKWLSLQSGETYRLPSEAEWEYAARAGTQSAYSTGDVITSQQVNLDLSDQVVRGGYYRIQTTSVGQQTFEVAHFSNNDYGLHDMHGNVAEWVLDCWNSSYVLAPVEGEAWLTGDCRQRVIRGGSWQDGAEQGRSAYRDREDIEGRAKTLGFRLVREL